MIMYENGCKDPWSPARKFGWILRPPISELVEFYHITFGGYMSLYVNNCRGHKFTPSFQEAATMNRTNFIYLCSNLTNYV